MKSLPTAICCGASLALALAAPPAAPTEPAASGDAVQIVKSLGPLADHLLAAFSMDRSENGSLVFSTSGVSGHIFGPVNWVNDAGHQCASFARPGTRLIIGVPQGSLKQKYTLAAWVKFPVPTGNAMIWDGIGHAVLGVKGNTFVCGKESELQILGHVDPAPVGWHHLALTCDGYKTSFFFDGAFVGKIHEVLDGSVRTIGSPTFGGKESAQCDCLDDMLILDRPVTPQELATLKSFHLPIHPPSTGDLAAAARAAARAETPPPNVAGGPATPPAMPMPRPGDIPMPGRPKNPVAEATPPPAPAPQLPPVSPALTGPAAALIKNYGSSLVFVSGENGEGSGFLASYGKGTCLFTNAHVAARLKGALFKTLEDEKVPVGGASVAVGHDIFLIETPAVARPLEIMIGVDQEATVGDDVVVLGNAGGAGVINTLMGKIVGLGPNLVEVDAPFVPGNSGSPIVHLKTGKVIAIATYAKINRIDPATKQPLATPEVRRFGYRIDSVKTWQPVNWATFNAQAVECEKITTLTTDLFAFADDLAKNHKVSSGQHTNPAIQPRLETYEAETRGRKSEKDLTNATNNLIAYLKLAMRSDVLAAQQHFTYDYFQRKLVEEQRQREPLAGVIQSDLREIQASR